MKYTYTFSVWPDEGWVFHKAIFDVFRLAQPRVEMAFTEAEFVTFRGRLADDGFTLRAVTRVPFHEPEAVI